MQTSYHVQSILSDHSGNESDGFKVLGSLYSPLQSMPPSWPNSCAYAVPCCAYLQEQQQGCLSQKSAARPISPLGPLFQPNLVLFYDVLIPTVLGWLHSHPVSSVWDIHINPLSSGNWELKGCHCGPLFTGSKEWALVLVIFHPGRNLTQ